MVFHRKFIVDSKSDGQRIDRYLCDHLPQISRSSIKKSIEQGHVFHNDKTCHRSSIVVRHGHHVMISLEENKKDTLPVAQKIPLDILFEDEDIIVINKPAGLVVHPAPGHVGDTLVNALLNHCGESLREIGDPQRPGIVHRLDRGTSGVIVVAKTQNSYDFLTQAFASRAIERLYYAFCWGVPFPQTGEYKGNIGRDPRNRKRMAVVEQGKWAVTHYQVQQVFSSYATCLSCSLETGRTHQVRVHCAHYRHPLIGDPLYLKRRPALAKNVEKDKREKLLHFPRQALHAATLGFEHPVSGKKLFFSTPLPQDMQNLEEILLS